LFGGIDLARPVEHHGRNLSHLVGVPKGEALDNVMRRKVVTEHDDRPFSVIRQGWLKGDRIPIKSHH
jgi:hypothetical protein